MGYCAIGRDADELTAPWSAVDQKAASLLPTEAFALHLKEDITQRWREVREGPKVETLDMIMADRANSVETPSEPATTMGRVPRNYYLQFYYNLRQEDCIFRNGNESY